MTTKVEFNQVDNKYISTTTFSTDESWMRSLSDEIKKATIKTLSEKIAENVLIGVLERINIKAITNIATIEAGKIIGKEVSK